MNFLFVCKYNRYRSRVGEAVFNHYNKNKDWKAKSAGIDIDRGPIISIAGRALTKLEIPYNVKRNSMQVNSELIEWADKIVILAEEVDESLFPEEKRVKVGFPDEYSTEDKTLENVNKIKEEVVALMKKESQKKG